MDQTIVSCTTLSSVALHQMHTTLLLFTNMLNQMTNANSKHNIPKPSGMIFGSPWLVISIKFKTEILKYALKKGIGRSQSQYYISTEVDSTTII